MILEIIKYIINKLVSIFSIFLNEYLIIYSIIGNIVFEIKIKINTNRLTRYYLTIIIKKFFINRITRCTIGIAAYLLFTRPIYLFRYHYHILKLLYSFIFIKTVI